MTKHDAIKQHYSMQGLLEKIKAGLALREKTPDNVEPSDLAMVDEFHVRGRDATLDLFRTLKIKPGDQVLDVGSGLGGPARVAFNQFAANVTGIDLSDVYTEVGNELNRWLNISDRIRLIQGNALDLPFDSATFDSCYSLHVSMNIEDKAGLYSGICRVLKPGAKLGIYDILKSENEELLFPVPWADDNSTSFLASPEELGVLLSNAGFQLESMEDDSQKCLSWMKRAREKNNKAGGAPPLGLHTILGPSAPDRVRNLVKNISAGTARVAQIIARKV
ncbi:MAG: class I SAM-dependent methyltransferase [SAR324 cluster bacterium]|nr:class I SAM-dependent methyltransferase [SAR324 cluster bacterium]